MNSRQPHTYLVTCSLPVTVEHGDSISANTLRRRIAAALRRDVANLSDEDAAMLLVDSLVLDEPPHTQSYTSRLIWLPQEPRS